MGLLRFAALGALGYAGYKYYEKVKEANSGFGSGSSGNFVRDSGPAAMTDPPQRAWTETDESSDQSFPASDPPARY